MKTKGMFKNWKIDRYYARKGKYLLWVASGFSFFKDEGTLFLTGLSVWERYKVWQEFKRELKERSLKVIEKYHA